MGIFIIVYRNKDREINGLLIFLDNSILLFNYFLINDLLLSLDARIVLYFC